MTFTRSLAKAASERLTLRLEAKVIVVEAAEAEAFTRLVAGRLVRITSDVVAVVLVGGRRTPDVAEVRLRRHQVVAEAVVGLVEVLLRDA